ncbi:MAG: GNAT family N-acetyltransferase [Bacteroidota bacterium]
MATTRSAKPEDLPVLLEFEQGIIDAERPFDQTLKDGHISYYDLGAFIEAKNVEVLVAEADGQIIASGYIKIEQGKAYHKHDRYGYIGFVYVRPEYRGKGVVQQIINGLNNWAKSQGISEVRLDVYAENDSAVRAYEKAGFGKNLVEMRIDLTKH